MGGWYKRQRNIPERPWFKDAKVLQLFDYLEATAYVTDGMFEGTIIRRGSCPTTRPDMMEATGLSYKEVDRCLRILSSYGEIIVKGNYRFSIITICGYDTFGTQQTLFGTTEGTAEGTAEGTTEGTTEGTAHLLTKEERYKDILITPYSPYKKERERQDLAKEVQKRYNKIFDGILQPSVRLCLPTRLMVEDCLRRFGMQAVDLVFEQIKTESFSLGQNHTGFIADFQYIFRPDKFQQYLERALLRLKKAHHADTEPAKDGASAEQHEIVPSRQDPDDYEREMRQAAAEGNIYAQRLVEQWDKQKNKM